MKKLNRHKALILAFAILPILFCERAAADITIYPMSAIVDSSGSAQISAFTNADKTEFVKTQIKKVSNPGSAQEYETAINPAEGSGLMVAPAKFALSPGATKIIRLVNMKPVQTETLYRVYFENVKNLEQAAERTQQQASLGVNVIWGVLVYVPPAEPKIDFTFDHKNLKITNTGNIHLKISSVGFCPDKNTSKDCVWSKEVKKAIYPGQQKQLSAEEFNGNKYAAVRIKYTNWVEKTSAEKVFVQ